MAKALFDSNDLGETASATRYTKKSPGGTSICFTGFASRASLTVKSWVDCNRLARL
jgi:hypothetical protein